MVGCRRSSSSGCAWTVKQTRAGRAEVHKRTTPLPQHPQHGEPASGLAASKPSRFQTCANPPEEKGRKFAPIWLQTKKSREERLRYRIVRRSLASLLFALCPCPSRICMGVQVGESHKQEVGRLGWLVALLPHGIPLPTTSSSVSAIVSWPPKSHPSPGQMIRKQ